MSLYYYKTPAMKARTKRFLISAGSLLVVLLFSGMMGISAWIGKDCRENIEKAKSLYSGNAEEALIAYLQDARNSNYNRTHLAIWTLGQIRSEKALPLLKALYQNDPEGTLKLFSAIPESAIPGVLPQSQHLICCKIGQI